ncbi:hypothetical protein [Clostridium sp.]
MDADGCSIGTESYSKVKEFNSDEDDFSSLPIIRPLAKIKI